MFIITVKDDNRILMMGNQLDHMSNGYPRLIEENVAFPTEMVNVAEVEEVPEEVEVEKYCYTNEDGFYENPNWHEPSAYDMAPPEVVNAIIDQYTAELIEGGIL